MKHFKALLSLVISLLMLSSVALAAQLHCDVCGMTIPEKARHYIMLKAPAGAPKPLHVCSASCLKKAKKGEPKYTQADFADFNHPEKFVSGDKAFFLIKSSKIKADLGEMAMPPYIGAFSTKAEAEAAKAKYGDGEVVQGLESALK
ncbi:MAG: nitrous oxide reductase accessory protein NosL [Oligoflexia bacterium]|nr:nitrous oxide reductase accessory protein NosL [Oligoflexia bacterium]